MGMYKGDQILGPATYQSLPKSYIAGPRQVSEATPRSNHREKSRRKAEKNKKKCPRQFFHREQKPFEFPGRGQRPFNRFLKPLKDPTTLTDPSKTIFNPRGQVSVAPLEAIPSLVVGPHSRILPNYKI